MTLKTHALINILWEGENVGISFFFHNVFNPIAELELKKNISI